MATIADNKVFNIEEVEIEDGKPVDNIISEKQMRLLTEPLYTSWNPSGNSSFFVAANVGIFTKLLNEPVVPDVLLSLHVTIPKERKKKEDLCYYLDKLGKPPEVAVEIVSNKVGKELEEKLINYGKIGVSYYVVFDPRKFLLEDSVLQSYQYTKSGVEQMKETWFPSVELGVRLWSGFFEGEYGSWLRWCDYYGEVIPTGKELAESERLGKEQERLEKEQERIEKERERTEKERERLEKEILAKKLRELGIDPAKLISGE